MKEALRETSKRKDMTILNIRALGNCAKKEKIKKKEDFSIA